MGFFNKVLSSITGKKPRLYRSGLDLDGYRIPDDLGLLTPMDTSELRALQGRLGKKDERIAKKPVEVFQEIILEPTECPRINFEDLEGQITLVERRRRVLREEIGMRDTPDEDEALIFLYSRQKLQKLKGQHNFTWPVTTREKIEKLCKTYQLSLVSFRGYYKTVPMEAIDELEKFCKEYEKFTDTEPDFKLIIDDAPAPEERQSQERKKDPILLASSPFGRWYHVLGAWDHHVAVVDELLYGYGKEQK